MILLCYILLLLLSYSASRISTRLLNNPLAIFAVRPRLAPTFALAARPLVAHTQRT